MIDLINQIEQSEKVILELKEIQESQIELNVETPNERQIDALLNNMEYSHTPDRIRKYIEMNINFVDLGEFWKMWGVVESFRISQNPERQFVHYCNELELTGFGEAKYIKRKGFDSWYTPYMKEFA